VVSLIPPSMVLEDLGGPSLRFRLVGELELGVVVLGASPPEAEDVAIFVEYARRWPRIWRLLVRSGGAGLDAQQRKAVALATDGRAQRATGRPPDGLRDRERPMRAAVCTEHEAPRGTVTALSWMDVDVRAFGRDAIEDALGYLALEAAGAPLVRSTLKRLERGVGRISLIP